MVNIDYHLPWLDWMDVFKVRAVSPAAALQISQWSDCRLGGPEGHGSTRQELLHPAGWRHRRDHSIRGSDAANAIHTPQQILPYLSATSRLI
jgi:hypothetical protein